MKALITGSEGFVGGYLRTELEDHGYDVTGADILPAEKTVVADLLDPVCAEKVVFDTSPDVIFHLAGQANVPKSWQDPRKTVEINVNAAICLMEAVRKVCPGTKMILIGSSDEYGELREAGENVTEETPLRPMTPYAVSKVAQEQMGRAYAKAYGLKICMTRSFNHGGAGQKTGFLIPDFASGIVRVERGESDRLLVGNLNSRRDFTHVKDVVRAYRLIAERGLPGEIYNVGSGETHSAGELLETLRGMAVCAVAAEQDPKRLRPSDTPVICCNHDKLTRDTGWMPEKTMRDILADTLEYYRALK